MKKVRSFMLAALLLALTLVGAVATPFAHAQASTTLAPSNGVVRNGVYSLPAVGLTFDLPQSWERSAYQWNEVWGTAADARLDGASYVVDWTYTPVNANYGPSTLLTLAVYRQAAWDGLDADIVAENANWVVEASMTRTTPYPLGSADGERYEARRVTMEEVDAAVSLTGEATTSDDEDEDEPTETTFEEPDLWCDFSGTGATLAIDGDRANFECETDDSTVVLLGEAEPGIDGLEITRATLVDGDDGLEVESSKRVLISHIELEDGTLCAEAGTGATFGVEGRRVNFTCEEEGIVLAGNIELGDEGWEILKAEYELTDDGRYRTLDSEMAVIARLGVTDTNPEATASVTGTVTYLQRIAIPEDAAVLVQLLDVSLADAPATVLTEQLIDANGRQVPFEFALYYDPSVIQQSHTYAVRAEIMSEGGLLFTTSTSYPVITQGNPTEVDLVLEQVD